MLGNECNDIYEERERERAHETVGRYLRDKYIIYRDTRYLVLVVTISNIYY